MTEQISLETKVEGERGSVPPAEKTAVASGFEGGNGFYLSDHIESENKRLVKVIYQLSKEEVKAEYQFDEVIREKFPDGSRAIQYYLTDLRRGKLFDRINPDIFQNLWDRNVGDQVDDIVKEPLKQYEIIPQ